MTSPKVPNEPGNPSKKAMEHPAKEVLSRGKYLVIIIVQLLLLIAFIHWHHQIGSILPALSTAIAFGILLLPGIALSVWFMPGEGVLERLPTAFILSIGIMILPGTLVLTLHLSLDIFIWIFLAFAILAYIALIIFFLRHPSSTSSTTQPRESIHPLLLVILFALAMVLCVISFQIPLIGDDWAGMPYLQNYLVAEQLNLYEPFHGTELPPTSRSEFGVWALDFAMLSRLADVNPIIQYRYLRPIFTLIALVAFYNLARQIVKNRSAASFLTAFWIITLLASISWGKPGYDLVARINQDKFALRYILLPVSLQFLLIYFRTYKLRDLIFFGLAGWTTGGTHPMGPVLVALPCLGFGLIHLAYEHDWRTFGRLVLAALCLATGIILPMLQLLGVSEDWLAFSLQNTTDPNLLTRLGMATSTQHLWLLPNGQYALHPAIIMEPIVLIAALGLPFLLWMSRKSQAARLLLGTFVIVPVLLYFPPTGMGIGRLITPWLLYRLFWSVPLAAVLTIGWCLWSGTAYLTKLLSRPGLSTLPQHLLPAVMLVALVGVQIPSILTGQAYLKDVKEDPIRAQCQDIGVLLKNLSDIIHSDSIVLANHDLNFCIPAYSPYAKVLEYRWTTTLSRFPADLRDVALRRVKDMLYFSSARFVDDTLAAILDRYNVGYILIEQNQQLNLQLKQLPDWFDPVIQDSRYILYSVKEKRPALAVVSANTALLQGDGDKALTLYQSMLDQDADTQTLAHLGLSELYLSEGQIDQAIDELNFALKASPAEGLLWGQLADTLVAGGRIDEAIEAYKQAEELAVGDALLKQRLGHAYRLDNQPDSGRLAYDRAAGILAPEGSARWYLLRGDFYAQAGWYSEALDAYRQSLTILPGQIAVEISIGDVYMSMGDMESARAAYEKAARIDRWASEPIIRLGVLDEKEGNLTAAIQKYRRAVYYNPITPTGYTLLSAATQRNAGEDLALRAIQDLPGYELILPGPLLASGTLYADQGQYELAREEFERAIERFPLDTDSIKITLGSLLAYTGNWEAASSLYNQAMVDDIQLTSQAYIGMAHISTYQAQLGQAIGSYYKSVRADTGSAVAHVALGDGYMKLAQTEKAKVEYERAIEIHPDYLDGYIALGALYLAQGDDEQSLVMNQQALTLYPEHVASYLGLASVYQYQGNLSEAIRVYLLAEGLSPDSPVIPVLLAQLYQATGEMELARAQLVQAIEIGPTYLPARQALGNLLLAQHDTQGAWEAFNSAVEMQPNDATSRVGIARVLLALGKVDDALQQLKIAAESSYHAGEAYLALGNEYVRRADWNQAISSYLQAINADPNLVSGYIQLGRLYEGLGEWDKALMQYQTAVRVAPTSGAAFTTLGASLYAHGEVDKSLDSLYQAILMDPTFIESYIALGQELRALGQPEKALEIFNQGIQSLPGSALIWSALGSFHEELGQREAADTAYKQAITIEPGNISAWINLCYFYQGQGRLQEAEDCNIHAINLEPGNADVYISLGDMYLLQGKVDLAETVYQKAIEVDQSRDTASLKLGDLYSSLGHPNDAIQAYQQAIDRIPSDEQGYIDLGTVYQKQGDMVQAQAQYERAIQVALISADTYIALGGLYQVQGRWDEALGFYQQAIQAEPYDITGWVVLGDFYLARGEPQEAESAYRRAISTNMEDADGYLSLGYLYKEHGWSEQALAKFKEAVEHDPGSGEAFVALGDWYRDNGILDLAEANYREAQRVEPSAVPSYLALGALSNDQGNDSEAEKFYRQAIQVAPLETEGYLALGALKEQQGDEVAAETIYLQAIAMAPINEQGYISLATLYATMGKWEQAQRELETAVMGMPTSAPAHVALGEFYQQLNHLNAAKEQFEIASSLDRSQSRSEIALAEVYRTHSDWANAIDHHRQAIKISPTGLDGYTALALTYQIMEDLTNAQLVYTEGINNTLDKPKAYLARGTFYETQGEWEKAQKDFETAWHLDASSPDTGIILANFLSNRGDIKQALDILNQINGLPNADAQTSFELGNLYSLQGDWTTSIEYYKKAIETDKTFTAAYAGLANLFVLQGDTEEALKLSQVATIASPDDSQAYIYLGDVYREQRKYSDAYQAYEKAVQLDPENMSALLRLDDLMRATGGGGIELSPLIIRAETAPTTDRYITLANLYQSRGEWQVSLYWLQKAALLEPYNSDCWLALGNYYQTMQQLDQALEDYNRALKYQPVSSMILLTIGSLQEEMELTTEALATYNQAIEADPNNFNVHQALANLLVASGQVEEGVKVMQDWVAAVPGNYRGYVSLGGIYSIMGETTMALDTYQMGLNLVPGAADLYAAVGNIYGDYILEQSNNLASAKSYLFWTEFQLERSQTLVLEDPTRQQEWANELKYLRALEMVLAAQKDLKASQQRYDELEPDFVLASEAYQHSLELQPSNESALLGLGITNFSMGNIEEAIIYYQEAVDVNPDSIVALGYLGYSLLENDEPDRALQAFTRILIQDPLNSIAQTGLSRSYRGLEHLDLAEAAAAIEASQVSWDSLVSYFRWLGE